MHTKDGMARINMETTLAVLGGGGRNPAKTHRECPMPS